MSAHGDTRTAAYDAACTIAARGERPSVSAIRAELGGKGGQQAIQNGFHDWLRDAASRFTVPDLPDALQEPMKVLWTTACNQAFARWNEERETLETTLADLQARLDLESSALDESRAEISRLSALIAERDDQLAESADAVDALTHAFGEKAAELDEQGRALTKARDECRQQERRCVAAEGRLAAAEDALGKAREYSARVENDLAVVSDRNARLNKELDDKQTLVEQLREDVSQQRRLGDDLRTLLLGRDKQLESLAESLRTEQTGRESDTTHWMGVVEEVRGALRDAKEREAILVDEKRDLLNRARSGEHKTRLLAQATAAGHGERSEGR